MFIQEAGTSINKEDKEFQKQKMLKSSRKNLRF